LRLIQTTTAQISSKTVDDENSFGFISVTKSVLLFNMLFKHVFPTPNYEIQTVA